MRLHWFVSFFVLQFSLVELFCASIVYGSVFRVAILFLRLLYTDLLLSKTVGFISLS